MALVTQEQLERHLQITFGADPDPVVADYLAQAQAAASGYCGTVLEEQAIVGETFEVDQWEPWHRLHHIPLVSISSVTEDGDALVAGTDFITYQDGRLRRISDGDERSWTRQVGGVVVDYTAGYGGAIPTPDDLELGIIIVAAELFRHGAEFASTGTAGGVASITLDGSDAIAYNADPVNVVVAAGGTFIPPAAKQLLGRFRRRRI